LFAQIWNKRGLRLFLAGLRTFLCRRLIRLCAPAEKAFESAAEPTALAIT
jgi:hypothetical protein